MRLWTLQPVEVYEILKRDKIFRCATDLSEGIIKMEFKDSYDWLVEQMCLRIGNQPIGVEYPVWAWHTYDWKYKKLDLRIFRHWCKEPMVCIEFEIEDENVVLSDEDNWHYVLNNWYIGDSKNEEEWDKEQAWLDSLEENKQNILKRKSWEKIFDVDEPINTKWMCVGRNIQATFWELKLEQVKELRYYNRIN